jgi:hypothetical protein
MPPTLTEIMLASRESVLEEFRKQSCIATTRVIIDVCAYFGIKASPMAVSVIAFTKTAWAQDGDGAPVSEWPDDRYSVGIGFRSRLGHKLTKDWDGHLVAVTDKWMLDGSLDQISRPEHSLSLCPLAIDVPPGWDGTLYRQDGVVITYQPLSDLTWRTSRNWSRRLPEIRRATGAAIRSLREQLACVG